MKISGTPAEEIAQLRARVEMTTLAEIKARHAKQDADYEDDPTRTLDRKHSDRARLIDIVDRAMAVLKECSDDLAVYVEADHEHTRKYPALFWKFERDFEPVKTARKLIAEIEGGKDA